MEKILLLVLFILGSGRPGEWGGGGGGGREVWLAERKVGSLQIYLSNFGFCMCFCCSVNMFKKNTVI